MRGCHDLNGRKNLNEKSGPWQDSVANKDTEIGFVCEIFENSLEGEIPATAISGWRTANPKGELTTSIIQPSSQTEQLGLDFCGSQKWDSSWSCWITGLCREINLSGILSENDIVRCGEGWLFTRWPLHTSICGAAHFVHFCTPGPGTEGNVTTWRSVDTWEIIRAFCPQLVNLPSLN